MNRLATNSLGLCAVLHVLAFLALGAADEVRLDMPIVPPLLLLGAHRILASQRLRPGLWVAFTLREPLSDSQFQRTVATQPSAASLHQLRLAGGS